MSLSLGEKIRELRIKHSLTLKDLSSMTGLSISFISRVENGKAELSLTQLKSIATALDVPAVMLFADDLDAEVKLVRPKDRRRFYYEDGRYPQPVIEEFLLGGRRFDLEVVCITLPPGTDSGKLNSHEGSEFTYVLRGKVTFLFGDREYAMEEGDVIGYPATIPHGWKNAGDGEAAVLLGTTPPTF
ncbi:MAG TPA: helix-turn-helix domain-containing protein [Clostridia bacterium]|nr:helix-turn-helix domain-containing protein [Clostridia bacterium]